MSARRITQSTLQSCLILLVVQFAAACDAHEPWPPIVSTVDTATVPVLRGFPELTRPATIYLAADTTYTGGYENRAVISRYVFYEDGTFALQAYATEGGRWEWKGRHTRADVKFDLRFDNTGLPWVATGTLRGDTLSVSYNINMALSDFEDADYVRVP